MKTFGMFENTILHKLLSIGKQSKTRYHCTQTNRQSDNNSLMKIIEDHTTSQSNQV